MAPSVERRRPEYKIIKCSQTRTRAGVKNISNSSGAAHAHHDFDIKRAFFDPELKIFRGQCFMVMNHIRRSK